MKEHGIKCDCDECKEIKEYLKGNDKLKLVGCEEDLEYIK